jgi:hypothetical protein
MKIPFQQPASLKRTYAVLVGESDTLRNGAKLGREEWLDQSTTFDNLS